MKYPYKKIDLPPGLRREFLLKPIIPVYLFYRNAFVRLEALIDSGADFCVFDSQIADILGIQWKKGVAHEFIGITGEKGRVFFHPLSLQIGKTRKTINCGFSKDLSEQSFGILGQEGFFENFDVTFSFKREFVEVRNLAV